MSEVQKPKRKTHTSSKVKNRYNEKAYTKISVAFKKDVAAEYKSKCDELGISYSQIIKEAVGKFLDDNRHVNI